MDTSDPGIRNQFSPSANVLDAPAICPLIQGLGRELRAVVQGNCLGPFTLCCKPVQGLSNASPGQPEVGLQAHTLATPLINEREDAKCPSVEHLVVDKIHAPCWFGPVGA
jgi:hypothetical protein